MRLEELPRAHLASLPTPLEEMTRIREELGGPRIFLKRDDLTGLGFGGNKLRKLEFLMGDALSKGADTIVTSGAPQTNHGRLTAAAAAKLGLKCVLVITEEEPETDEGNIVLYKLLGAQLHYVSIDPGIPKAQRPKAYLKAGDKVLSELVEELKAQGRKPYVIPRGGRSLQGTSSYAAAMLELYSQLMHRHIKADYIVLPAATCSTMTGIVLGSKILSLDTKIIGICVSRSALEGKSMLTEEFAKDSAALGYDFTIKPEDILITDEYLGEGYGIATKETREAIKLFAEKEAVFLDPVYTGKAMGGLLDLIRKGYFSTDDTIVFFHTGGSPVVFTKTTAELMAE